MHIDYIGITYTWFILNRRLTTVISFNGILHGFRAVWGTGTAALEDNILRQLTDMKDTVLFKVFLDLRKAYDALDREIVIDVLAAYRVGPRTVRLLMTYWYQLTMVAKTSRYFWSPIQGVPRCHRVISPVPHNIQCGGIRRHLPLGDGGDAN